MSLFLLILLWASDAPSKPRSYPAVVEMHVGGTAMLPSFQPNQAVMVSIPALGCHVAAQRGDVVLYVRSDAGGKPSFFIQRVVGVPGDTVEFREDRLVLNGARVEYRDKDHAVNEILPGGRSYPLKFIPGHDAFRDVGPVKLEDAYYVVGDSRDDSFDSRMVGPVPSANICGLISQAPSK